MKLALFHNFTDKSFTGYWDGKPKTFKAGEKKMLPLYLAEHYAKHLVNSVLISQGQYNATSPKKPREVPLFWDLFQKACIIQDDENEVSEDEAVAQAESKKEETPSMNIKTKSREPQIIGTVEDEDEEVKSNDTNSEADKEGFKT